MTPRRKKRPTFTSTERCVFAATLLLLISFGTAPLSSRADSVSAADQALTKAERAADRKSADFWTARYAGLWAQAGSEERPPELARLLDARKLVPAGFVSAAWDPGFVAWFERALYPRWGADPSKVRERFGSVEIAHASDGKYFLTVVAYPEWQVWYQLDASGVASNPLYLALGSSAPARKPVLFSGKRLSGDLSTRFSPIEFNLRGRWLHYVWRPEWFDVEGDGLPEAWVRYNLAGSNGFIQVLDIYKLEGESLKLFHSFVGENDGIARRLGEKKVEVGKGTVSFGRMSRLELDRHLVETWEFKDGAFEKLSERTVELLLGGISWRIYHE